MSYDVLDPSAARLWRFAPNWSAGFNVRRAFKTDVAASRDNTEQRRALRIDPRIDLNYRSTVQADDRREANHWLRAWQNKAAVVPDFARFARLADASSAATDTLDVDPMPAWVAAGQRLILCGDEIEEVQVESVAGTTITLVDLLANNWPTSSVLRPTFFGLMNARISTGRLTPGAAEIDIDLACYPGGEPPRAAGSAWASFNSREIFTLEPDFASPLSLSELWPVESVDVERGRTAQFRPIERQERLTEAEFRGLDVATATQLEQFFDRHKGRRTAFYMPSGEKDFDLAATAGSGTTNFLSSGLDIATDFGSINYALVETAIAVCLTNGTRIYRQVTDIDSSGGNSRIHVNAAWGVELNASNVARISWMPVTRFASDEMTTSWRTTLSANARLSFQTVRR